MPERQTSTAASDPQPGIIRVSEIAAELGVARATVYALLEQGLMPGIRPLGRVRWLVCRDAYQAWKATMQAPVAYNPPRESVSTQ